MENEVDGINLLHEADILLQNICKHLVCDCKEACSRLVYAQPPVEKADRGLISC